MKKAELFDIMIDNVNMDECIKKIDELIIKNKNAYVVTPNVDHIVKLQYDTEFMEIYKNADLVLADGVPIIWASRLLGKSLKEKVSGSDLFPKLCEYAADKGYKVFFLGAREGVAKQAEVNLLRKYPELNVVGTYSPKFGFESDIEENTKILKMLKESSPDILFVGVGAPKQEKWIYKNKNNYNIPVSLGIGASFDFIAGSTKRAPLWMQKIGLEWFYRFMKEPRRMFRRYFIEDSKFAVILLKELGKLK